MSAASVTVFTKEVNGQHVANTYAADAVDRDSEMRAVLKCGARHLGVEVKNVRAIPDSDHVFVVYIYEPHPRETVHRFIVLWLLLVVAVAAVASHFAFK